MIPIELKQKLPKMSKETKKEQNNQPYPHNSVPSFLPKDIDA